MTGLLTSALVQVFGAALACAMLFVAGWAGYTAVRDTWRARWRIDEKGECPRPLCSGRGIAYRVCYDGVREIWCHRCRALSQELKGRSILVQENSPCPVEEV